MKIHETHPNGAEVRVSGFGARKYVEAWRGVQPPKKKPKKAEPEPKVKGVSAYFSGDQQRDYESYSAYAYKNPVVNSRVGFSPNE